VQIRLFQARLVQLEPQDPQGLKDLKAYRALLAQRVLKVCKAYKASKVFKAQLVYKASKAILAQLDPQVLIRLYKAPQARLDLLALIPLCQVQLDRRVYRVFKANKALLGLQVLQVLLAQLEALATQVQQAHLVLLAQQEPLEPMETRLRFTSTKLIPTKHLALQPVAICIGTTQHKYQPPVWYSVT
jgi:hypothetical protein